MSNKVVYVGKDLEAMSFAVNYHKWILDEFAGLLGKNIIEVGAGTGSFYRFCFCINPLAPAAAASLRSGAVSTILIRPRAGYTKSESSILLF